MAVLDVNLTRIESINLKKSLKTAMRGHKLLKDKLDELIKYFLELVKQNQELRQTADNMLENAYKSFSMAQAVMSEEILQESLIVPAKNLEIDVNNESVMSVKIPKFKLSNDETSNNLIHPYGYAFTTKDLDDSVDYFLKTSNVLVKLAENEKSIFLLAEEIEKTRRRVNALENVTIPNYKDTIKYIQMKLDENERANITRLMKVKDMMNK